MPGGGKSTIGRHLSKRLGREFVDSDVVIERRIGASIRSFFETEGESAFRDIETSVLSELLQPSAARVIATGGGAVLREANRLLLAGSRTCTRNVTRSTVRWRISSLKQAVLPCPLSSTRS